MFPTLLLLLLLLPITSNTASVSFIDEFQNPIRLNIIDPTSIDGCANAFANKKTKVGGNCPLILKECMLNYTATAYDLDGGNKNKTTNNKPTFIFTPLLAYYSSSANTVHGGGNNNNNQVVNCSCHDIVLKLNHKIKHDGNNYEIAGEILIGKFDVEQDDPNVSIYLLPTSSTTSSSSSNNDTQQQEQIWQMKLVDYNQKIHFCKLLYQVSSSWTSNNNNNTSSNQQPTSTPTTTITEEYESTSNPSIVEYETSSSPSFESRLTTSPTFKSETNSTTTNTTTTTTTGNTTDVGISQQQANYYEDPYYDHYGPVYVYTWFPPIIFLLLLFCCVWVFCCLPVTMVSNRI
jgi:hypothetical protein